MSPPAALASFPHADVELAVALACADGEAVCGDSWVATACRDGLLVAAIDGLGHGAAAGEAAARAVTVLRAERDAPLPQLMTSCHAALAGTRGAALTLARIDVRERTLTWLGVGNVAGVVVPGGDADPPMPSALLLAGVVGDRLPQLLPITLPLAPGDTLVLSTDGIDAALADGLRVRGALQPLAEGLLQRHRRGDADDALVLLARYSPVADAPASIVN